MKRSTSTARIAAKTIFPVADMGEAITFYRSLGFIVEPFDADYAVVRHDDHELLHLRLVSGLDPGTNEASGFLHVSDADDWHQRWTGDGVAIGEIADRPWAMREFSFTDPSGNLLRVGHNL